MNGMKRLIPIMVLAALTVGSGTAMAQSAPQKVGLINIQAAIVQSVDGQKAARELQTKFAPKQSELEKLQQELVGLQDQLRNQEKTLSEDARNRLMRSIDDKTRALNRSNEDFNAEAQTAQQDTFNEIGGKMVPVIEEYAKKNGFTMVFDVSQIPVLYAEPSANITPAIIEQYNQLHAAPAAAAPKPAATAPAAPAATAPAAPKP